MDVIERIWSSWSSSGNSENLVNGLSDLMLNISVLSTLTPCTFSLAFGIEWWFFLKTNGSLFKGQLLLHGNVRLPFLSFILRSRGRCVFTTRQFHHFFPLSPLYIPGANSAEKVIKSYTQTSSSSSCLRNSRWQHTFHIPKVGCSERDRLQLPLIYCPPHSIRFINHRLGGWLPHCLQAEHRGFRKETLLAKALLTRILAHTLWKHLT